MIRNETFRNGVSVEAECYDLTTRTYTREEMGVIVVTRPMTNDEWLANGPQPLDETAALATLLVITGAVTLADAANAVNQPEQALIDEAEAWYYVEQEGPL
jgi:Ni,Fe-hydrogenase III small subunit